MKLKIGILVLLLAATAGFLAAQVPAVTPLTQKEVLDLLKAKTAAEQILTMVSQRGVDFDLTPDIEKKLRKAKAADPLVELVRASGPTARAARGGGPMITPEEGRDFKAIQEELDPDRAVQMVKDFETKYPSSSLLSFAYTFAANAYQQKNEIERVVEYGEKSLKLKSDNLLSLIIMAAMLPQPQLLRGGSPDKEKRLTDAEGYAKQALDLIEKLPAQPGETDEQFKNRKAQLAREPHSALGMIHLQRSSMGLAGPDAEELTKAEEEYKTAVSLVDPANPQDYYRLGEAYAIHQKLDEAIAAFTKAGELGQGTVLKTYADQRIEDLRKKKAQSQSPAKP